MQVSSILQQNMVDDLLLVAIDTRHHDSHHEIVLEGKLFSDQCRQDPNFSAVLSEILASWTQGNRFAGHLSV